MFNHHNIASMYLGYSLAFNLGSEERFLICAPLASAGGVICNFTIALIRGATMFIEEAFDPVRALATIVGRRITAFGGVPTFFEKLAQWPGFDEADITCLSSCTTGGATVSSHLLRAYQRKDVTIRQAYVCTEACGGATVASAAQALEDPVSCGYPTCYSACES
jgi:fatty-acyl-CoA synthase